MKNKNQIEKLMDIKRKVKELDCKVDKIQKSTVTKINTLLPLHNCLRSKSKFYYRWHLNLKATTIHLVVLFIYTITVLISSFYFSLGPFSFKQIKAEPIFAQAISVSNPHQGYSYNYKGNLHCHSTNSDGSDSPSVVGQWYADNGYDFYSITDHNFTTSDPEISGILWLGNTEEDSSDGSSGHMNHINITTPITSGTDQGRINNALGQGGKTVLNHINRVGGGWTQSEIMDLDSVLGLEIFNGNADMISTDTWDSVLSYDKIVWGSANDDAHTTGQRGDGYIVVNSNDASPTKEEIINQMTLGNFYASRGFDLSVSVAGEEISASTTNGNKIRWIKQSGEVIKTTNAQSDNYTVSGSEKYVRIEILDGSDQVQAWSQPLTIFGEGLTRSVGGWLAWWDQERGYQSLQNNVGVLDEIYPCWYKTNSAGEVISYDNAEDTNIINFAQSNSILVIPLINNYINDSWDADTISNIINNPSLKATHINNIVNKVTSLGYDGIDIDYENLNASDRDAYSSFIEDLSTSLHTQGKLLYVAVHAKTSEPGSWNGPQAQDWTVIGNHADKVRIMCYDYHWSTSDPGAIAPYNWVDQVITFALTKISQSKIVMGTPAYGYDWIGSSGTSLMYEEISNLASNYNAPQRWDGTTFCPWFTYTKDNINHEVWFEDAQSLQYKLNLVNNHNIGGIAIWRLGGEDSQIWNVIENKFGFFPDNTSPYISQVTISDITTQEATISWTTDENSNSQVEYGLSIEYGDSTALDLNMTTSHSVGLSGLAENTTYHFKVKSEDASGNPAQNSDYIFNTKTSSFTPKIPLMKNESGDYNFYIYQSPSGEEACSEIASDLWNIPAGNNIVAVAYLDNNKIGVIKNESGDYNFYLYNAPSGQEAVSQIGTDMWNIPSGNNVVSIAGLDSDSDGQDELAVLKNESGDYNLYIYDIPSGSQACSLVASDLWNIPSGNNAVSICGVKALDNTADQLAILKNESGDYNLYIYSSPIYEGPCSEVSSDLWNIPSGNNIISIAGVDYDGSRHKLRIAAIKNENGDHNLYVYTVSDSLLIPATLYGTDLWNIPGGNNIIDLGG